MGRDKFFGIDVGPEPSFQSTRPAWGATNSGAPSSITVPNFNPRAPHGARHGLREEDGSADRISIHAPRMGRDSKIVQNI